MGHTTRLLARLALPFALGAPVLALQQSPPVPWEVDLDPSGTLDESPLRLLAASDGGVISVVRAGHPGVQELIATKLTENGDTEWTVRTPLMGRPSGWLWGGADGALDAADSLYLAVGNFQDGKLQKYDASGAFQWERPVVAQTGGTMVPSSVVVDGSGNAVVGGTTVVPGMSTPYFEIHQYDGAGNLLWHDRSLYGAMRGMEVGPTGEVFGFGQTDVYSPYLCGQVARYEPGTTNTPWRDLVCTSGFIDWDWGSLWFDPVVDMAVNAAGQCYGIANGYQGVDPWTNPPAFRIEGFDPAGTQIFWVEFLGNGSPYARGVDADDAGNVYVTGSDGGLKVWRFDASGSLAWERTPSASTSSSGDGISIDVDAAGNVLVMGEEVVAGQALIVEALFRSDGTEVWSRVYPGATSFFGEYPAYDIVADARGNRFVASTANSGAGTDRDAHVAKIVDGGDVGQAYCSPSVPNSTGVGATLGGLGSASAAADNVTLVARDLPANTFTLLLTSTTQGMVANPGGSQGILCLGGAIGRYVAPGQIRTSSTDGRATLQIDIAALPQPTGLVQGIAGQTWNFQAWYRDANPGLTSNLSEALAITLQ